MDKLHIKLENLKGYLRELDSVAIAFSSGVDSTFLLKVAHDTLGDKAIAITAVSCSFPKRELSESTDFCTSEGITQLFCETNELAIPRFKENPVDRCYICKKEIFTNIINLAAENGIANVCEGSNTDDDSDYRPGHRAIKELGVKSPLRFAELSKAEIRELSKELGLNTWDKPSFACLSTRFPYGELITREGLQMVDRAEQLLIDLGFTQERVRVHGRVARIEVKPEEFDKLLQNRELITNRFKEYGFDYAAMDLMGYRTGSMNETINTSN